MIKKKTKLKKIRVPLPKQHPKVKTSAKVYSRKKQNNRNQETGNRDQ